MLIDDPIKVDCKYRGEIHSVATREGGYFEIGNNNYVICDAALCNIHNRQLANEFFSDFEITEIYFENDVDKCKNNDKVRPESRQTHSWDSFDYEIPDNITPLEIWQK